MLARKREFMREDGTVMTARPYPCQMSWTLSVRVVLERGPVRRAQVKSNFVFYAGDRKARKLWLPGVTTDGAVMPEQSAHCRLAGINPLNGCYSETKGWHLDDWTAPHAEVQASVNFINAGSELTL